MVYLYDTETVVIKKNRNRKDIVLVMSGQFSHKVVLKSLRTKPQVENDHAVKGKRETV